MSKFGFVYALSNRSMPGLFKIGMTDRSPSERALELSKATGCPTPFELMFYTEVFDARAVERNLHEELAEYRVDESREFFRLGSMAALVEIFHQIAGRPFITDIAADEMHCEELRQAAQGSAV